MDIMKIESILSKFPQPKGNLIAILHEMQNEYNYLPEEELRYVSKKTGVALSQVYSIATFYNRFSLQPKGKHQICVCLGTACHVKGAQKVMDALERSLEIGEGETTDDLKFSLEAVRCIGACSLAPAVVINDEAYREMTPKKMTKTLKRYK
jgi:NADH-quinone oxidoreductase E subunit